MDVVLKPWSEPRTQRGLSSIILVTYNSVAFTKDCVRDIYKYADARAPFEIIVADNMSSDDTVSYLRSLNRENLTVIENGKNLGFGAGCNVGARVAKGDYLVFLNNDTLLCPGWLERMLEKLDAHPQLGMVGPMTNVASNAQLLPPGVPADAAHYAQAAALMAERHAGEIVLVRRMIGFCMALPRAAWEACGPFSEAYGIGHYEDDDLCARLEVKGYKIGAARDVYVHHFAGQSFNAAGLAKLANMRKKALIFYRIWGNRYLDWPDLRTNLQDTPHVVWALRYAGHEAPDQRAGELPRLITCVAQDHDEGLRARLTELWDADTIFSFALPTSGRRSLGEAFNAGIACHDARGHLLAHDVAEAEIDGLLRRISEVDAEPQLGSVRFTRAGRAVAYYVTRDALREAGPLALEATNFDALIREHQARVRAVGLRVTGDAEEAPRDISRLGAVVRRFVLAERWRAKDRGRWSRPAPVSVAGRSKLVNITMLSYNRLDFTQRAIAALRDKTEQPYRLVVVDNGSSRETVAWLKDARSKGMIDVLLLNERNLGVAAAANQGWLACESDYYVKLDNDIVIEKAGWLSALVRAADTICDAGMVGYSFEERSYPLVEVDGVRVRPVVSLGGACVMVTRRGHERCGFWCEDYFPYSEEDLDMCLRLGFAGLGCYYLEDEHVGAHLPHGKATPLRGWQSEDDEGDVVYRGFKDAARRLHIGKYSTLWVNERLYAAGHRALYFRPGLSQDTPVAAAQKAFYRALRSMKNNGRSLPSLWPRKR